MVLHLAQPRTTASKLVRHDDVMRIPVQGVAYEDQFSTHQDPEEFLKGAE